MRRHSIILDMSCDKLMFWSDYCEHSDIKKKTLMTSRKRVGEIALALSLSKPVRDQKKVLMQKSRKIISKSILKIGMKEVLAS